MSSKEELYKLLLETSPFGTLFFAYGVCVDCNPRAQEILGCSKRQILGTAIDDITPEDSLSLASFKQCLRAALAEGQEQVNWLLQNQQQQEQVELNIRPVGNDHKELLVTLYAGARQAAPPQQASEQHSAPQPNRDTVLGKLAGGAAPQAKSHQPRHVAQKDLYFDSLTQLPNRQLLLETIREYLEQRADSENCAAVLMVDLDHFKDINDSWGHNVGDQVIRKVGQTLSRLVTEDSMVARLSGDEFMLFIPGIAGEGLQASANARVLAEKVKELIAHPIFHDGHEFILTASIGIAMLMEPGVTAERALQYADTAVYEAKRKGRNGIAFFDPSIAEKAQRQIGLNTKLRKAVDNQEFALYVQPQISIKTGQLIGGEALLRWVNADRITNMPSEFIPLLESSGLIVDVGHWVIRTACEYIRNFIDEGIWRDHMRLGINISPRQFNDPQLLEVIEHSLKSYEIAPHYLNFEITENLVIDDVEDTVRKMVAIKELGAMFSIDDFGIGYSSMIYLKRLPFDQLKIDREFIRNIHQDRESRGVVEAIMAVSRQYGLLVTAEGVESDASLNILQHVGCDAYQGAFYSMPVPVDHFKRLLAA